MKRTSKYAWLIVLAGCTAVEAPPTTYRVVAITDGDTLKVLRDGTETKVRLEGIDAPERGQPFGTAAKKELSKLCFGKHVSLEVTGIDHYGRTLARVYRDGTDLNHLMVVRGFAWHYVKYSDDQSLVEAQAAARMTNRGLWRHKDPIPPWDWRKLSKEERDELR